MPAHEGSFEGPVTVGSVTDFPVFTLQVSRHIASPRYQVATRVRMKVCVPHLIPSSLAVLSRPMSVLTEEMLRGKRPQSQRCVGLLECRSNVLLADALRVFCTCVKQ
eukprot:1786271-Rhodomonas_salina.1